MAPPRRYRDLWPQLSRRPLQNLLLLDFGETVAQTKPWVNRGRVFWTSFCCVGITDTRKFQRSAAIKGFWVILEIWYYMVYPFSMATDSIRLDRWNSCRNAGPSDRESTIHWPGWPWALSKAPIRQSMGWEFEGRQWLVWSWSRRRCLFMEERNKEHAWYGNIDIAGGIYDRFESDKCPSSPFQNEWSSWKSGSCLSMTKVTKLKKRERMVKVLFKPLKIRNQVCWPELTLTLTHSPRSFTGSTISET